ncbi:unnamed protein product [Protopolystoma xenopodis]|uniref:Uncharacterized protein n=1 Tax=Protopolystoma xenopodis TaxID=117903 RepID=A0A3S5C628_9PLAT|nr:unnamed protein product [Protopolystoma xenopodis]
MQRTRADFEVELSKAQRARDRAVLQAGSEVEELRARLVRTERRANEAEEACVQAVARAEEAIQAASARVQLAGGEAGAGASLAAGQAGTGAGAVVPVDTTEQETSTRRLVEEKLRLCNQLTAIQRLVPLTTLQPRPFGEFGVVIVLLMFPEFSAVLGFLKPDLDPT